MERFTELTENGRYRLKSSYGFRWRFAESNAQEPINKLGEYEDLEEQGLLLKLPCKVGDTVYVVGSKCLANVVPDEECDKNDCDFCKYNEEYVVFKRVVDRHLLIKLVYEENSRFIFDKTVFTTVERAYEKLKELDVNIE